LIKQIIPESLSAVIYNPADTDNAIVRTFLRIRGPRFFTYKNDEDIAEISAFLKQSGYESKRVVVLKKYPGRLFQKCPGTPNMICCNYRLINTCFNCMYDCSYCFLNSYLNSYGITQFIEFEGLRNEINQNLNDDNMIYRVGTGEFTDSLLMDGITGTSEFLMEFFSGKKNVLLEFKTKSDEINHLLNLKNTSNTVLAWSLNTERNYLKYESGCASIKNRINAASKAASSGFYLAFHFDPIIIYPGSIEEYLELVDLLFSEIDPSVILWISMGVLRYTPGFKDIVLDKKNRSDLFTGEMFPGADGKYRYLKRDRILFYKKMVEKIRSYALKPFIYLCMESSDVWKSVFSMDISTSDELENIFSTHLKREFFSR